MPKVNLTDTEISLILTDLKVGIKEVENELNERMDRSEEDYAMSFEMTEAILNDYKGLYEKLIKKAPKEFLSTMALLEMAIARAEGDEDEWTK
jgi:uncharacterized membrane-anchored protein YhcB (DUF1043 family)